MQTRFTDASWRIKSLDDIYYFDYQQDHLVVAIQDHVPQTEDEIELKIDDLIKIIGNHWNGYSKGINLRTKANGIFPSYKIKDIIRTAERV